MGRLLGNEVFEAAVYRDDKDKFVEILSSCPDHICMDVLFLCAVMKARKCLLAMIQGDGCISALEIYAKHHGTTPLAYVASYFNQAYDLIHLLLKLAPLHSHIKCSTSHNYDSRCPLDHLLVGLSFAPQLRSWAPGNSLKKLVFLLCQPKMKSSLDSARLLVSHTDGINDIAWGFVREGRLASLAALLLVAQEKVLDPFDSGSTIGQRITDMVDRLSSEGDLDDEAAKYQCMLIDACKLLDIFKRAGRTLSLYCSSMHEHVPPDKVLIDAAGILKKAGFVLQPTDLDLRDCYRECPELFNARLFKLADPPSSNKEQLFPSSLTHAQGLGAACYKYPYFGDCRFFHKVKIGPMVNSVTSASRPRPFSIAAAQIDNAGSSIPRKLLAYIARTLKRGIKF